MPLINCPTCTTEVSPVAAACPRCAHPIAATQAPIGKPVTVEQTSKKYKKARLLAWGLIIMSIFLLAGGGSSGNEYSPILGTLMLLGGIGIYIYSRMGAWWSNG